ncbi:MAG: helix-turn-helix domain-containing protein, partial [Elusimicrobia bacterium]|nr:helix-turn-helix domain-containing protein [Elusimicrobiota bacterium]
MKRRRRRPGKSAPDRSPAQMTYAELRTLNPAAARQKLLEAFDSLVSLRAVAGLFETDRKTVRKAIRRFRAAGLDGLADLSRRPHHSPNQTSPALEQLVLSARRQTGYGALRLHRDGEVPLPPGTIRNILRRHPVRPKKRKTWRGTRRRIYQWDDKEPLSFFQTDLKVIRDRKALPHDVYAHHERVGLPLYQWTACCVRTRLRFLAYSNEKTMANGLLFMCLVVCWVRMHGLQHRICFQTDWGEEFGGKSPRKLASLDRRIFAPLGAVLLRIRKGRTTDNAIVERSHRSDDEEFYAPKLARYPNTDSFLLAGFRWQCRFNIRRPHFGKHMNGRRPLDRAREILPQLRRDVALFPTILLDRLGPLPQLLRDVLPITQHRRVVHDVPAHYQRREVPGAAPRRRARASERRTSEPPLFPFPASPR